MKNHALSRWRFLDALSAGIFFGAALSQAAIAASSPRTNLLFVTDAQSKALPADQKITAHLESLGFAVTTTDAGSVSAKTAGMDLVVISATVAPHRIESKCRDLRIPIVTWNPDALPDLEMTGSVKDTDYGTDNHGPHLFLYVFNSPHAMSGGLPNGFSIFYSDSLYKVNWGKPGLGATVICTIPGQLDKATLFGYEKGALMNGTFSAPARRVMLFLTDTVFELLNENGVRVFDAAICWAAGVPPRGSTKTL